MVSLSRKEKSEREFTIKTFAWQTSTFGQRKRKTNLTNKNVNVNANQNHGLAEKEKE